MSAMRIGRIAAPVAVFALSAGVALAAKPVAGASYAGKTIVKYPAAVSFKVSANGKRVTGLTVPVVLGCQGGGIAPAKPGSATITANGKFSATLFLRSPLGKVTPQKEIVTGTFGKRGHESGTIKSVFTSAGCGTTVRYSTTAA